MYNIEQNGTELPLGNIFCIGRNYTEHILELNNKASEEPMVFMKPTQSILASGEQIIIPKFTQNVHYECEVIVYISKDTNNINPKDALDYIGGLGIGLDLTARDVQDAAKAQGHPWLKAKGFKGAACISSLASINNFTDLEDIEFSLTINDKIVQHGNTKQMIFPITTQIAYLSQIYSLKAGDIIYTGTPKGVGKLNSGDRLKANLADKISATWSVA